MHALLRLIRLLITLAVVAAAVFIIVQLWNVYMLAPWTRDGRVFAQTVVVAPEVAGTVVSAPLHDNETVQKGAVLFQIDPTRFRIALDQAEATLAAARLDQRKAAEDAARRRGLNGLISKEDLANTSIAADITAAQVQGAEAAVALAKLNLARATVYAPVSGIITHFRLQAGDYVNAGQHVVTLIDTATFQIRAYFEETKIGLIHPGDAAHIQLMGYATPISGHVRSIGRGISDVNDTTNFRGLPQINPVFDWVRLAQRIPVDITIDHVPSAILLVSGMTCSVDVGRPVAPRKGLAGRVQRWLEGNL